MLSCTPVPSLVEPLVCVPKKCAYQFWQQDPQNRQLCRGMILLIYTTQVIFELVGAPVGRANVLHDILFEPIKSQKFRIEDFNVWIIGVEM